MKTRWFHLLLLGLSVLLLAGCEGGASDPGGELPADGDHDGSDGDEADGDDVPGDGDAPVDGDDLPTDGDEDGDEAPGISWQPCPLVAGEDSDLALCAHVPMPLFWEADDGSRLDIGAKLLVPEGEPRAQLWLLQGGPGASGVRTFGPYMKAIQALIPDIEIYTLDHRGVGESGHLNCPEQEAADSEGATAITAEEWPLCLAWIEENLGDDFNAYSTRNAAHDLAGYIEKTRKPGVPVFVWGGSYGTYLGQRYLLLHPDQADGVILDSIHAASVPAMGIERYRNMAGKNLFDLCADDPDCAAHFDGEPWDVLAALHEKLENGHCAQLNLDSYGLGYLLGWLTWYRPYNVAAPALVYRLDRCAYKDMLAVVHMYDNLFNGTGDLLGLSADWWSTVLNAQIAFSDQFWGEEFEGVDLPAYFAQLREEVLVGVRSSEYMYPFWQSWPRYDEPQARSLPQTDIPVLMLQGKLDGATPEEQAVRLSEALKGPHQHYVVFPYSAHGVLSDSWMPGYTQEPTCGMQLLAQFIENPRGELDLSCVEAAIGPDFAPGEELSRIIFGEPDLWDNAPGVLKRERLRPLMPDMRQTAAPRLFYR